MSFPSILAVPPPPSLESLLHLWQWLGLAGLVVAALVLGTLLQWLLLGIGKWIASRTQSEWDDRLLAILPGPARIFLAILAFHLATPLLELPPPVGESVEVVVRVLLIITVTWFASRFVTLAADLLQAFLGKQIDDPGQLRSLQTQIAVPRAILRFLLIVLGVALVLLQFEVVRSVGVSLVASAGLAGIIIGLAAQRTIGNILAGIQLAFFQPMRIGDAVVVEGEFGWIEEIGLTYVVVKVWDQRRLVVPVSYFLERPFQNWTKVGSELLGTVFLYTDYTVPVDAVRAELQRLLGETELWDKRAQGVQVTNLSERGVEVRVLVSARNSGDLFNLRCQVRERLLAWLQTQHKEALPVHRVEMKEDHEEKAKKKHEK